MNELWIRRINKKKRVILANLVAALHWIISIFAVAGCIVTTIFLFLHKQPVFLKVWVILMLVDIVPFLLFSGQCPLWILEEWLRGESKRQRYLEDKSFIVHYAYKFTGRRIPSVLVATVMIIIFAVAAIAAFIVFN